MPGFMARNRSPLQTIREEIPNILVDESISSIWIISTGNSLSYANLKKIPKNAITITINASICLYTNSTFQISSDGRAITHYHSQSLTAIWVSQLRNRNQLSGYGLKHVCTEDIMDRRYTGSGSEAIYLAYVLWSEMPSIREIHTIGMDCAAYRTPDGKEHVYTHLLEPHIADWQRRDKRHSEPGWREGVDYTINYAKSDPYRIQYHGIATLIRTTPAFRSRIISHSYFDLSKIDPAAHDLGFRDARQTTKQIMELNKQYGINNNRIRRAKVG